MEVKINREIRNYTESHVFWTVHAAVHFFCSRLRRGRGPLLYPAPLFWGGNPVLDVHFGAAPFAMLGFVTYHGMTAEQFIWAWLRSEMLEPKEFKFEDSNYYYAALKDTIEGLQTGRPVKRQPKEPKHFHKRKEAKHD